MPKWKDVTTYSRDDRERKPTTFGVECGEVRLVVTCAHLYGPGEWIMHGYGIGINTKPLNLDATEPADKAMAEAEMVAMLAVKRLEEAVRQICDARGKQS